MTTSSTGRNAPCPCGSGKKFKRCCLGREDDTASGQGVPGPAQTLREALEGQPLPSMEEAQAFVTEHIQQQNQRPLDDFDGLSPDQMGWVLYHPFTSPRLVVFPEILESQPSTPITRLFSLLVEAIGEQGLKPTAKGNLPRRFCREAALAYWGEQKYQENTRFGGINQEMGFPDLHMTRLVAELAGLIRTYEGKFILSQDCRHLLAEGGLGAVYPKLFRAYVEQFNWAYRDGYVEAPFIQQAFLFTLYLLWRHGHTSRPQTFYEDAFLRAFPMVLNDVPTGSSTAEETLRRCYTWRTLVNFAGFLGLAEVEKVTDDMLCDEYRIKALPLLSDALRFKVSR